MTDEPDPIAQLERSHRRLEEACDALLQATAERDLGTVTDVLRFFGHQGKRHEEDEERSLFPRLAATLAPLAATLARLEEEHRVHEALHAELERLASPTDPPPWAELDRLADRIARAYRDHIEREEKELFPEARKLLRPDERAGIVQEMRERRGR